jgi:hypothetical protein
VARTIARRWNRREGSRLVAYDPETDEFLFASPDNPEGERFQPIRLGLVADGSRAVRWVKHWAVGTLEG